MHTNISIYKNIQDSKSQEKIPLDFFLEKIRNGYWQDLVLPIRTILDEDKRRQCKSKVPYVTISGIFGDVRNRDNLKIHSGFISMDIDKLGHEVNGTMQLLKQDPYCYSAFTSISGTGVCALFKVEPDKHLEAFIGIADYLLKKYQIIIDPSGKDTSRPRFVSYDPELFINENCLLFKKYLPKEKKRKITSAIFVKTEFDEVINKMVAANVNCVEDYRDWLAISFGLADQFGEGGRWYFHKLSSCSSKYETSMCDRQYTHALKREGRGGSKITIATIYWFAKQAGINIYSQKTKRVASITSSQKKAGLDAQKIIENLKKFENIEDADDIVKQAFVVNDNFSKGESIIENVLSWLKCNFNLKRNVITRKIENDGIVFEEIDFNTIFLEAKKIFEDLTFDLFMKIIMSRNIAQYNPIKDFFEINKWDGTKRLDQLAETINSNTGTKEWRAKMVSRWMVGIIENIYGATNELNFILVGKKNTGKTFFFRKLLPIELKDYFANSQLNRGTDDEILMCEKIVIFNDEYGGKRKDAEREEKRLMAADYFSLRVPYGRGNETMKRLATLCGTCNETDILDDATGNRRIIIMEAIGSFNFELYNSLDKTQLLCEAKALWDAGERPVLNDEEIEVLEKFTDKEYGKTSFEAEMVTLHFLPPESTDPWDFMTATQVKNYLELHTKEKININKLGAQLRKMGYARKSNGKNYGYDIRQIPKL